MVDQRKSTTDRSAPPLFGFWHGGGIWTARVFRALVQVKAPSYPMVFSERYGHKKPVLRVAGWRLFFALPSPPKDAP